MLSRLRCSLPHARGQSEQRRASHYRNLLFKFKLGNKTERWNIKVIFQSINVYGHKSMALSLPVFFLLKESSRNTVTPLQTLNRNSIELYSFGRIVAIHTKYSRPIVPVMPLRCGILMRKNGKQLEIDIVNIHRK